MGNWFFKQLESRIIIQGLDAAGKTSLLYRLKLGEVVTTIPTIGFNVETISVSNLTLTCWDLGGRDRLRPLFRHYYTNTKGIVYVIDSTDKERLDYALDELVSLVLLDEAIFNTVVMVLANKQDLAGAMTAADVEDALKEKYTFSAKSAAGHTVLVRPCSVVTMEGVDEAFREFSEQLRLKRDGKAEVGLVPRLASSDKNDVSGDSGVVATAGFKMFGKDPLSFFKSLFY